MNAMCASVPVANRWSQHRRRASVALLALLVAACGGDDGGGDAADPGGAEETAAGGAADAGSSGGGKTVDPATVGSVSGVVTLDGSPPERQVLPMVGEAFCVQAHSDLKGFLDDRLLVQDGKVQNAFVWVKDGLDDYSFSGKGLPDAILDQEGCLYTPKVLGVQLGQKVFATTQDPVLHNVHSKPTINRAQNIAMPQGSAPKELRFRKAEVMVPVGCDVHAWMKAYIGVVDHPYFAVTDGDGAFALPDLPPGDYTLGVWHEELGEKEVPFTLEASGSLTLDPVVFSL